MPNLAAPEGQTAEEIEARRAAVRASNHARREEDTVDKRQARRAAVRALNRVALHVAISFAGCPSCPVRLERAPNCTRREGETRRAAARSYAVRSGSKRPRTTEMRHDYVMRICGVGQWVL